MTQKNGQFDWLEGVKLKEFFERILAEQEKRYEERFQAVTKAAELALSSQKELTNQAFRSSEQAIKKAEDAQAAYNARSNEFRAALDDSDKRNIKKDAYDVAYRNLTERMDTSYRNLADRIEAVKDITTLLIPRAEVERQWAAFSQELKEFRAFKEERAGVPADIQSLQGDVRDLRTFKDNQAGSAKQSDLTRVYIFSIISAVVAVGMAIFALTK